MSGNELAARRCLVEFYEYSAEVGIREITRLARTIDRWSDEILAYHRTGGASNWPVENMHVLAEKSAEPPTASKTTTSTAADYSADSDSNGLPSQFAESKAANHT